MQRYFEGAEAETISAVVHNLILDFARGALNDAPRPATLTPYAEVTVTQSRDLASECYKAVPGKPFLCIVAGDYKTEPANIPIPGGLLRGTRHTFAFELDMSLCDKSATTGNKAGPVHSIVADRKIVGAVRDAFNNGYFTLQGLKLTLLSFDGDAARQNDPTAINPHLILIQARTLNS
jgi:hypothetical protein